MAADLRATAREVEEQRRHLVSWMAPEKRRVPMLFLPGRAEVVNEPLGVASASTTRSPTCWSPRCLSAAWGRAATAVITAGFDTFSHRKASYRRPSWFIDPPLLNAPYPRWKQVLARWLS